MHDARDSDALATGKRADCRVAPGGESLARGDARSTGSCRGCYTFLYTRYLLNWATHFHDFDMYVKRKELSFIPYKIRTSALITLFFFYA